MLRNRHATIVFALALSFLLSPAGGQQLPTKSSNEYNEIVRRSTPVWLHSRSVMMFRPTAACSGHATCSQRAAGWATGVTAAPPTELDTAAERLSVLVPSPGRRSDPYLLGLLESSRGRTAESIAALRKAVELIPRTSSVVQLAEEVSARAMRTASPNFSV